MKLVMELTKEEILRYLTICEPLKNENEFDEYVIRFNTNTNKDYMVVGVIPTYEEYFEEYKKASKLLIESYEEQTKALHNFEQWLDENKNKTFSYEELENKLLELKLSYKGFNGGKTECLNTV